jgi:heat shock protein HslJ
MPSRASRFTIHIRPAFATLAIVALAACQPPHPANSEPEFRASVSGVEWELVELDGKTPPTGAGGRRAAMRFDADTSRVGGFSGCNRFGGSYTITGDSLRFGPIAMTRMACTQGMELEAALSSALQATRRYELSTTQLKLFGPSGPVARFSRQIPEPTRTPDT